MEPRTTSHYTPLGAAVAGGLLAIAFVLGYLLHPA